MLRSTTHISFLIVMLAATGCHRSDGSEQAVNPAQTAAAKPAQERAANDQPTAVPASRSDNDSNDDSAAAEAADKNVPVVLELFTSQGCSSCPPADSFIDEIGDRSDVIALSFHVDYWNDLGWRDPFSSSRWSERQHEYARRMGASRIYTPQIVVQGQEHMVGSARAQVKRAMARQAEQPRARLAATAVRDGDAVKISVDRDRTDLAAVVVVYEKDHSTAVGAGENRSRTLHNDYVVRELVDVAASDSAITVPIAPAWSGDLGVVVMLRDPKSWEIVAAVKQPLS